MSRNWERWKLERAACAAVAKHKRLWGLHLAGNAALLGLAYAWLWIPSARAWQLLASGLLGLAIVAAGLWLHGTTLVFFRQIEAGEEKRLFDVFRATLPRLPALGLWVVLSLLLFLLISRVGELLGLASAWLGSALTLVSGRPVSPGDVGWLFSWLLWAVKWIAAPLALLPLAGEVAAAGWEGFRRAGLRRAWSLARWKRTWLSCLALFALGAYLPWLLVGWVPKFSGLAAQAASLAARFLAAYLLLVTAWLLLAAVLGRRAPVAET